ncbi:MAG TPA: hydrogenase 4 subunit F [Clostridia bacterium]|nr:hydrogenase 4 subunit F [Clostridia bacterium]
MEYQLFIIPVLTVGLLWLTANKTVINSINAAGAFLVFLASMNITGQVMGKKVVTPELLNNLFYIDSFSGLMLITITFVLLLISVFSIGYMNEELRRKHTSIRKLKLYYTLLHTFILIMIFAITTQNMGVMWIAIEAITLAAAFLVGFYNDRKAIEAAWKYIIIGSVGMAFALLGIVLLYYSSVSALGHSDNGLNWQILYNNAAGLQGSILKLAFIFIIIGFGTKVGLSPMHTWLPDAHSQAPSPISALLSGVLLNISLYAIIRVMIIVNKNLSSSVFTGRLLIAFGIISVGTAAIFILVQQDYKRALAYSSIEHMGIISLGLGIFTPVSIFGALYHVINHALTKSMLFMASGNIYLKYDTKKMNKVQGVIRTMPVTGTVFLLGILAITGMPPFSIFSSELNIIIASFKSKHYISASLLVIFLTIIFAGFITQFTRMFYGKPLNKELKKGEISIIGSVVLISMLVIIFITGLYIPSPVKSLLDSAQQIILGGA